MTTSQLACLRDAIASLTEVRVALNGRTNAVLLKKVDEAIHRLMEIEHEGIIDDSKVTEVLRILGQGIALIPVVAELLQKLNR